MVKFIQILIDTVKSIKDEYLNRTSRGKWMFIKNIGIFVLNLIGVRTLEPHLNVYWYTYSSAATGILFFISMFYTFWYFRHEPLRSFQNTAVLGVVIPVCKIVSKKLNL